MISVNRPLWAALLFATLFLQATPASAQAKPQLPPGGVETVAPFDLYTALERVSGLLTSGDIKSARTELEAMLRHPGLEAAPTALRYAVYFTIGITAFADGDPKAAHRYIALAGEIAPALRSGGYWQYATLAAMQAEEGDAAVEGLLTLATTYPEVALAMGDAVVFRVLDMSSRLADHKKHIALLDALWLMGYQPKVGDQTMEYFWLELLASYLDNGESAQARDIVATLRRAPSVIIMSVDARFDSYRPADPFLAQGNALEAELAEVRALAAGHLKELAKVDALARTLRKLNRDDEALSVLQTSLDALNEAPAGLRVFEDQDMFLDTVLNAKAEILLAGGEADEAISAQHLAMQVEESLGTVSFFQRLNLARMYVWLERPTEALDTLAGVKSTETAVYFAMMASEVRVCANQQLGNTSLARDELTRMLDHADVAYDAYRMALLCVSDLDAVEKLIVERIEDPRTRLTALVDLQSCPEPVTAPEYYRAMVSTFDGMSKRPALKAALAKYGRVLHWPMGQ